MINTQSFKLMNFAPSKFESQSDFEKVKQRTDFLTFNEALKNSRDNLKKLNFDDEYKTRLNTKEENYKPFKLSKAPSKSNKSYSKFISENDGLEVLEKPDETNKNSLDEYLALNLGRIIATLFSIDKTSDITVDANIKEFIDANITSLLRDMTGTDQNVLNLVTGTQQFQKLQSDLYLLIKDLEDKLPLSKGNNVLMPNDNIQSIKETLLEVISLLVGDASNEDAKNNDTVAIEEVVDLNTKQPVQIDKKQNYMNMGRTNELQEVKHKGSTKMQYSEKVVIQEKVKEDHISTTNTTETAEKEIEILKPQTSKAHFENDLLKYTFVHTDKNMQTIHSVVKNDKAALSISRNELFDQIVEKAQIIKDDSYSQISIQLKPDSLGKLSLQLVLEKGMVTAKFLAENNQVKDILESNFNQLRDMLNEKGVAVHSITVSVGQQNEFTHENGGYAMWEKTFRDKHKITKADDALSRYIEEIDNYSIASQNIYDYHDGMVDYKA